MAIPVDLEAMRASPVKRPNAPPHVAVCIPVGGKLKTGEFKAPSCSSPDCVCPNHGKTLRSSARGNGLVSLQWSVALNNQLVPPNTTIAYFSRSGIPSPQARNEMTERALEARAKYIFYLDDDVILDPYAIYNLHNILERYPDIGLVTGLYCTRNAQSEPVLYGKYGEGAMWDVSIDPDDPPEDMWACGGGCIMARAEDIRKMKYPYWEDIQEISGTKGGTIWGHDILFVRKFHEASGKRVTVKGSVMCGHFDLESGKVYELPKDSPPYKHMTEKRKTTVHEIVECPSLDASFISQAILRSSGQRRIYLLGENTQSTEDAVEALKQFYQDVNPVAIEGGRLFVCKSLLSEAKKK